MVIRLNGLAWHGYTRPPPPSAGLCSPGTICTAFHFFCRELASFGTPNARRLDVVELRSLTRSLIKSPKRNPQTNFQADFFPSAAGRVQKQTLSDAIPLPHGNVSRFRRVLLSKATTPRCVHAPPPPLPAFDNIGVESYPRVARAILRAM